MRYNVTGRAVTLIDADDPDEARRIFVAQLDRVGMILLDEFDAFESDEQP